MGRGRGVLLMMGAFIVSSPSSQAQDTGAAPVQGFSAQALVSQLSLYLPEESTRGMYAGLAGRNGGGGRAGQPQNAGGAQPGGREIQFTRDPKLFLTRDQLIRLLPILIALKDNPLPSPARAKKVEAEVAGILTAAQKAEWADFRAQMQKNMELFRQQISANAGSGANTGSGGQGDQGQADARQRTPTGGMPQASLLQRRQKQLEAFIAVMQERLTQISG